MANIRTIRGILNHRLAPYYTGETLLGIDKQLKYLKDFILNILRTGESNSILIIGPRGSGKSALLEYVMGDLKKQPLVKNNFLHIHLNGFIHTDDWIALKSVAEQLNLDDVTENRSFQSFNEALTFLLETLRSGSWESKPILFTLDEFDLFCHHKRQTLLHNLFEAAQHPSSVIGIIGLTSNLNVVELFEKRMCSRFSHHKLHLIQSMKFQDYVELTKHLLSVPDTARTKVFANTWNIKIDALLQDKVVVSVLQKMFDKSVDIRALKHLLRFPVGKLTEQQPHILPESFVEGYSILYMDAKVAMLMDLSVLELSLLVAVLHLSLIQEKEMVTFELIYKAYQQYARQKLSLHDFDKLVVYKAFEHLKDLKLIVPAGDRSSTTPKEFQLVRSVVEPLELQEVLQRYSSLPTDFKQWASSALKIIL